MKLYPNPNYTVFFSRIMSGMLRDEDDLPDPNYKGIYEIRLGNYFSGLLSPVYFSVEAFHPIALDEVKNQLDAIRSQYFNPENCYWFCLIPSDEEVGKILRVPHNEQDFCANAKMISIQQCKELTESIEILLDGQSQGTGLIEDIKTTPIGRYIEQHIMIPELLGQRVVEWTQEKREIATVSKTPALRCRESHTILWEHFAKKSWKLMQISPTYNYLVRIKRFMDKMLFYEGQPNPLYRGIYEIEIAEHLLGLLSPVQFSPELYKRVSINEVVDSTTALQHLYYSPTAPYYYCVMPDKLAGATYVTYIEEHDFTVLIKCIDEDQYKELATNIENLIAHQDLNNYYFTARIKDIENTPIGRFIDKKIVTNTFLESQLIRRIRG